MTRNAERSTALANETKLKSIMKTNLKLSPKLLLLLLALGTETAFPQGNPVLLTTFTNVTTDAVAAVGDDRVLIGSLPAGVGGEAYLFSLNGTLLTTFTNPTPEGGSFGAAVAAVGSDRVLIGAYNYNLGMGQVGRAFLFSTNGTLLTTFTNPNPARVSAFAWSVAAVGSDRILINGTRNPTNPVPYPEAVYLFNTNGTLLTTIPNPSAVLTNYGFGSALAAVGSDRVLVGASDPAGSAAFLFSTNGALLTTFTNPNPAVGLYFGQSVTAVGSDRVLIGAYLFSTNGTLLTTFPNPTPGANDNFGYSVAAVGSSRVLIGAYEDGTAGVQSGSAYLFSTNGTLLNTITNPAPAVGIYFGYSVAAVGSNRVIIGGLFPGLAYLFALPYPPLSIKRNASTVSLSWITAETGLALEQTDALGTSPVWSSTTDSVSLDGLTNVVQQTMEATNRFFRLRRP